MPIYVYRCDACGHQEEFLQKVSDAPRTRCPSCGKEALTKMVTAAGFQLKGSGWYATDFKASGSKPASTTTTAPATATDSKAEKKSEGAATEAKSESKSESKGEAKKTEVKKESAASTGATGTTGTPSG
jgi:putative FmdB family regulatory protein